MEHIYFEAQLCSEIATLKEKSNNIKNAQNRVAGEVLENLIIHFENQGALTYWT